MPDGEQFIARAGGLSGISEQYNIASAEIQSTIYQS